MSRKGIILAVIIFVALGLYVFLVEKKRPLSDGKETLLKFDENNARRLIIHNNEKEIVLNKDKSGEWQITSPMVTKADDEAVNGLVSDLSRLKASQSLEVDPSLWDDFGLKKPGCEVTVLTGSSEERLSFGDKNPTGTSVYARVKGRDKIFLVPAYSANSFKKDLSDLKKKEIAEDKAEEKKEKEEDK